MRTSLLDSEGEQVSGEKKVASFTKRSVTWRFKPSPPFDISLVIVTVVHRRMYQRELLKTAHPAERSHRPLPSSKWQVQILCAIVQVPAGFLAFRVSDDLHRGAAGWTPVGHHDFRIAVTLHCFSQEFQRRRPGALFCDARFEHLPFVIYRALGVMRFPADRHKDLVRAPAPLRHLAHRF